MTFPNNPPGRAGISNTYPWVEPHPRDLFWGFIANAEYYGLPVNFLRIVGRSYTLNMNGPGRAQRADVWTNSMYLDRSTYDLLVDMNVDLPVGESTAILTAYHESTHAYLDLKENEAAFKTFIADGEKHYKDAPMVGDTTSRDPKRVFQEAAASYVGNRASTWWLAFEMLAILTTTLASGNNVSKDKVVRMANIARKDYNDVMKEMVFGYEESAWYSSDQVETTRPLSAAMKRFLDTELLEDKIPDDFDKVTKLRQLYLDLLSPGRP